METTTLHQETMACLMFFYEVSDSPNGGWEWALKENGGLQVDDGRYSTRQSAINAAEKWITRNMPNLVRHAKEEALASRAYRARKAA